MKDKKIKKYILIVAGIILLIVATVIIIKVENSKIDTFDPEWGPLREDEASVLVGKLEGAICEGDTYPSYYGGVYLKKQNLVILITKDSKEAEAEVREIVGQKEGIHIRYVKYSLNDLKEVQENIRETYSELYDEGEEDVVQLLDDVRGTSVSQENNEVVVKITEITNRKIRKFKKLFGDYDCVRYEEGGYFAW